MQHLRTSPSARGRHTLIGPSSGIESATIGVVNLAAGQEMHLDGGAERLLLCLSGEATLDGQSLVPGAYVWMPQGKAIVAAKDDARLLEVALLRPAAAWVNGRFGRIDAAAFERHLGHQAQGAAFETQKMVDRSMGAGTRIFAAAVQPGSGMGLHMHPFDQFYFLISGNLHFAIGTAEHVAGPGDLVVFPAGTAHSNWNAGAEPVVEITINIPEVAQGQANVHHLTISEN